MLRTQTVKGEKAMKASIFRLDDEEFGDLPVICRARGGIVRCFDCHETNLPGVAIVYADGGAMNPFMPYVFHLTHDFGHHMLTILEMWSIYGSKYAGTDAITAIDTVIIEMENICRKRFRIDESEIGLILGAIRKNLEEKYR